VYLQSVVNCVNYVPGWLFVELKPNNWETRNVREIGSFSEARAKKTDW